MTEKEWLACNDPLRMLDFLRGRGIQRKLRLFSCGCCRRVWDLLDETNQAAVALVENFVDGKITVADMEKGWLDASQSSDNLETSPFGSSDLLGYRAQFVSRDAPCSYAVGTVLCTSNVVSQGARDDADASFAARCAAGCKAYFGIDRVRGNRAMWSQLEATEFAALAKLSRCVFGNPFRPVTVNASWLTPTVVQLAEHIYRERAFDQMPILADALQDAGCDNEDVLSHCRGEGPHVRGCWVVDLLLGKV